MQNEEEGFSFKSLLVPLTTFKAIQWIIVIGLIVFLNSLFNGFLADDIPQIVQNMTVHSIQNIRIFFNGSTFFNGGYQTGIYYKPLLNTTFSLLFAFSGGNVFVFHVFQVALHIINTCILFLFFLRFFKKPLSFILSIIFLLHPINSEAVFYIAAMQETLFFFFGILALWVVTKAQERKALVIASLLLLASLFSKETGILFFCITAISQLLFYRKRFLLTISILIPTIVFYIFLRIHAVGLATGFMNNPIGKLSLGVRLLNFPLIFQFYITSFLFPINLAVSYEWVYTRIDLAHFIFPLITDLFVITVIGCFGLFLYKKINQKYFLEYLFFALWFFLGIAFHSQFFPLDATVAQRWFYFTIVGALGMIGVFLETCNIHFSDKRVISIFILVMVLLGLRTYVRSFDWKDEFTLYSHDVMVSDAYNVENGLSSDYFQQGNYKQSKIHAEKSITLYPYFLNYNSLGTAYFFLGGYSKARDAYAKALQYGDFYIIDDNLAQLEVATKSNYNDTKKFIEKSLKQFPYDSVLWESLAILYYNHNEIMNAKDAISKAYMYSQNDETATLYDVIVNNKTLYLQLTPKLKLLIKLNSL